MNRKGYFIIIDGIAGSGKSTILKAVQKNFINSNKKVFQLSDWKHNEPPKFEDISDFDVYFTYEPTRHWIGAAIRYELSREDNPYGGEELAHAFSLDRQIMYKRLILPALDAGKIIIQDRGISTSLVYQPIMPQSTYINTIKNLPGNKLAIKHAPDTLILTKLSAENAFQRIQDREDELKGVFGKLDFLKKLEKRFTEKWLFSTFEKQGTEIVHIDTNDDIKKTINEANKTINQILTKNYYA